ncbi:autotransporter-associated beta strand repeat-containing protein [Rhodopseudomonas sp. AAP120]|uniref:autotransporter outer membrane beta-barrel domain-containing protein n=1 Tax=Rhodopseudomonas sp. AAP120 TaxID=1523430 RepID=UPI001FDA4995|nr:autotransporter-associated beta strand repeat-containing protein [Rhodopseudomonas sp. AAP120]
MCRRRVLSSLLACTALVAVAFPAAAQQVWVGGTSSDYGTAANWSGPAAVPDASATAVFTNNGAPAAVAISGSYSAAGFTFNAGAPSYTISLGASSDLNFYGAGIVNNTSVAQNFVVGSGGAQIDFRGTSTAGNATIEVTSGGVMLFSENASGGTAQIVNNGILYLRTDIGHVDIGALSGDGTVAAFRGTTGTVQTVNVGTLGTSTTFSGVLRDGDAPLVLGKVGSGTLTLTGNSIYTGGTTISAGTLQIGDGGTTGSITGDIVNNATLAFDRAGALEVAGNISGSGQLTKDGSGTVVLTGTNTYTGGTTINAGTLQIGDGGTTGSIVGNIVNDGALVFARSDSTGLGNSVISGTGSVTLLGTTALLLAGAQTYTGGTTISSGSFLQIGSGGTTGSLVGNVVNNGILEFARIDDHSFNGAISGTGQLRVFSNGNGTFTLTGANTYTGGTRVSNGTLQIGNGGTSGSIVGNVDNRGTLAFNRSDAIGFGGVISGSGNLTKLGAGTLSLTGASTYTGGTTISAGTLQIGDGGTSGSLAGNISNSATLAFNRSDATSFGGVVSGSGQVIKRGAGNLSLAGISSYTGGTTVEAGSLSVNGSIASSSLTTVNAGAALGGNGTVGTTLINGGALAPGNSIGTLNVSGNLTFTAASSYMVEVSPTNADRVNVSGTATLGGATVNASFASGGYVDRQYTIVNATGGVVGTFGSLVNTNLPSGFKSSLGYDANNAYLNLVLDYTPPTPPGPTPPVINSGLNGNQTQVANALSNYFVRTGSIPIVFGALTPAGLSIASGETPTGAQQSTFTAMDLFMGVLTDPFSNGRGAPDATSAPMAFVDAAQPAGVRDAHAMIGKAGALPSFEPRWVTWGAGFGGSQTTDGNATLGSATATSRLAGIAAGADYWLSPQTVAGLAMAGGATQFGLANGLGSGRSDLMQVGGFIRHRIGASYLTAAAAYGWQDITTERTIGIGGFNQLRASFNANAYSARVEAGHRWVAPVIGGVGLTPYAAAQVTAFDLPAYAEQAVSGSGVFALGYDARTATSTRSELGLRGDKSFALDGALLTLRGRAAWAHEFDIDRSVTATFQALPGASFVVGGARPAADAALTTVSADINWLNGFSVGASFEGEFSEVTRSYAGKGVLRYAW